MRQEKPKMSKDFFVCKYKYPFPLKKKLSPGKLYKYKEFYDVIEANFLISKKAPFCNDLPWKVFLMS